MEAADNVADPLAPALGLGQERLRELFRQLKPSVWLLVIKGNDRKLRLREDGELNMESVLSGFCLTEKGIILTCAHGWSDWSDLKIMVRRLSDDGFRYEATVIDVERKWDMVLLSIQNLEPDDDVVECVELPDTSFIGEGDIVLHIGHPMEFVGSCLVGRAVFESPHVLPFPTGRMSCERFVPATTTNTPPYRVMGHVWYASIFAEKRMGELKFERRLHADLPIIQCNGLVCGPGSSGGPIYNIHGQLIGMLNMASDGYQIGVPLPIIREFVRRILGDGTEIGRARGRKDMKLEEASSSKKRKFEEEKDITEKA